MMGVREQLKDVLIMFDTVKDRLPKAKYRVLNVEHLLDHNVILEMDGLSSASDRAMFSEALTLYLYRLRLAQGPRAELTNLIVLEEAHHILSRRAAEAKESILETSIRMIRQYGIGYVFVDQSASLLSKVAFANSYATIALSQKLRADVQTMAGAMNLTEEQRDSLSTLPVGRAVVRLADEHPEAFLVNVPRCPIQEGSVSDSAIRERMAGDSGESGLHKPASAQAAAIPAISLPDKKEKKQPETTGITHPPSPRDVPIESCIEPVGSQPRPPEHTMSREEIRFLTDLIAHPLSSTVSRYHRLHFSRRRGNAIRQSLQEQGIIEPVAIATRSGQVMLSKLTDDGSTVAASQGLAPGFAPRESLEHRYWVHQVAKMYEHKGYSITREHQIKGNGAVDVVAERPGERIAIEIETGKSDIAENLANADSAAFDRIVLVATSAAAVAACQKILNSSAEQTGAAVQLLTWLDVA